MHISKDEQRDRFLSRIENPFYENTIGLRKSGLTFRMSSTEIDEYVKCKMDIQYFAEKYCWVKGEKGEPVRLRLRDYQKEAINFIQKNKNSILCIPTGCGKNAIIIHSMLEKKKYLILVPRIILMEQLKDEIISFRPNLKNKIQCIGDSSKTEGVKKDIVICVYNSIGYINIPFSDFEKIYIDEAHHINLPEIYYDIHQNVIDDEDEDEDDDDEDDDNINTESYIGKIAKLKEYNNNVYLSATIDVIDGFSIYKKEIREMIDSGYISDYQIHIPIFKNDPSDKSVCKHLIKNYRNIILYCSSQNEGKRINEIMNQIMKGCSEYIDCYTNKKKRIDIIRKYKEGDIPFLVNVRILVEGFDSPITKGVCFMHLPSNGTTLIQIIGRALRKHPDKTFANIILPFSNDEDENSINKFLKIISINDRRISKSFSAKTLGGYISIEKVNENEESEIVENELELKYNLVFNNMGKCLNGVEFWNMKLEEVKKYIDENHKRPNEKDNNKKIKQLGNWTGRQNVNYKKKLGVMKNEEISNKWTDFINDHKYSIYFLSNKEVWNMKLEEVKKYIDDNNKRPSDGKDSNHKIKHLAQWIVHQVVNYKKKSEIMKNEEIYNKWTYFINDTKYSIYFLSNEEVWNMKLEEVKKYIDDNNKRPSDGKDSNHKIKHLAKWIGTQNLNYKKKSEIMKNEEIYNKWTEFINYHKYSIYFLSNKEVWNMKLEEVKKYIDDNNKRPSLRKDSNDKIKQLAQWIYHQNKNYKKKSEIMKNEEIYNKWTEFINDAKYLL
jgi:superfamily II DNA or RNA helicase